MKKLILLLPLLFIGCAGANANIAFLSQSIDTDIRSNEIGTNTEVTERFTQERLKTQLWLDHVIFPDMIGFYLDEDPEGMKFQKEVCKAKGKEDRNRAFLRHAIHLMKELNEAQRAEMTPVNADEREAKAKWFKFYSGLKMRSGAVNRFIQADAKLKGIQDEILDKAGVPKDPIESVKKKARKVKEKIKSKIKEKTK